MSSLKKDIEVLESGLNSIADIFHHPEDHQPTPTHEARPGRVFSGVGSITIPAGSTVTEDPFASRVGRHTHTQMQILNVCVHYPFTVFLCIQPKPFGTPGDINRFKDWAITVVGQGVDAKDSTIKELKTKVTSLESVVRYQEQRLREMDGEARAHASANKMVKNELDSW